MPLRSKKKRDRMLVGSTIVYSGRVQDLKRQRNTVYNNYKHKHKHKQICIHIYIYTHTYIHTYT